MLDFLIPKTKVQAYNIVELPIEGFQIIGVGQINPYCNLEYEDETFLTVVNFAFDSKDYDEREGLVLSDYFTVRRCPKCKRVELVPTKISINMDSTYLRHEEEIAFDAYEEHPSRRHFPTTVEAYCNACSSCFDIRIKSKDVWIKEAKRVKEKDLITKHFEEFRH